MLAMPVANSVAPTTEDDLVWGGDAIAREIKKTRTQTYYLLEKGLLPARKVGIQWVATKGNLRRFFSSAA